MLKFINEIDQSLVIYQEYGVPETTVLENGIVIPNGSLCVDKLNQEIYLLIDGSWTLVTDNTLLSNTTTQTINITTSDVTSYENLAFYQASTSKYYTSSYNGSDELSIILPDVAGNSGKWFVIEDSLGLTININKKTAEYGSLHKTLYAVGSVGKVSKTYFYCDGVKWRIAHSFFPAVSTKIEGTYYTYVIANGTDVENAQELQDAYNLAKTKKQIIQIPRNLIQDGFIGMSRYIFNGDNTWYFFNILLNSIPLGIQNIEIISNGITSIIEIDVTESTTYSMKFSYSGATITNITYFKYFLTTIKKSSVVISPGIYNFSSNFVIDEEYVDLVSLDGNRSIIFNGTGTINVTANNVFIKGFDVVDKNFTIATNLNTLVVENCKGGDYSFGGESVKNISGTFTDCKGGNYSFGHSGTASGIFTNCKGGDSSFGRGGIASGIFDNCTGNNSCFGQFGIASGTFNNCKSGIQGFGGYGTASGVFSNCIGDYYAFGGINTVGILSGRLFYCRLNNGTFQTVSGEGRTYYCVSGDGSTNNQ